MVFLPTSSSLNYFWNLGSFLGISLVLQIFTGLFLYLNYNSSDCYDFIQYIMIEVEYGWILKIIHRNNARVIFFLLYIHLFKNFAVGGFRLIFVWFRGIFIIVFIIGAAFSGYALVGSQMRFWAVMVITSLLGVVPVFGEKLLYILWGGYILNWTTFQILGVVQFILPFLVIGLIVVHLISLHSTGRTDISGSHNGNIKITFFPFYWFKDFLNFLVYIVFLVLLIIYPYSLREPELFEEPNSLNSPLHIIPEWYFLPQYAILRSVPSKRFGVLMMIFRIVVFFFYSFMFSYRSPQLINYNWIFREEMIFWFFWLGILGSAPIVQPYITITQFSVLAYFFIHFVVYFFSIFLNMVFTLINRFDNLCRISLKYKNVSLQNFWFISINFIFGFDSLIKNVGLKNLRLYKLIFFFEVFYKL